MLKMTILRRSFFALPAAALFAQSGATAADARKAVDAFIAAVKKNDIAGVSNFLADDLVYTHSTGIVEGKQEYLAKLKAGDQKYTGIEFINPKIRTYGDTAVINTQARMTGATKGVPFDNTLFLMHVWVRQGGNWKLVAHQTTRKP
jgi:ketosteroid isomerase-like protein